MPSLKPETQPKQWATVVEIKILESAITNAENPQIVEDTYVTFKKLNQEYRRLNEI